MSPDRPDQPPKDTEDSPKPMTWWGAASLTVGAYVAVGLLFYALSALRALPFGSGVVEGARRLSSDGLSLALIQAGALGVVVYVGLRIYRPGQPVLEGLGVRPIPLRVAAISFVGGLALQLPLAELGNLLNEIQRMPLEQQVAIRRLLTPESFVEALGVTLAVVAVAPLSEEALCRGLLLRGMRGRYGVGVALVLSSLFFALLHLHSLYWVPVVYSFIAGLLLGYAALRIGSLIASIAIHAGANALPLLLSERLFPIEGLNTVSREPQHLHPLLWSGGALLFVACLQWAVGTADEFHRRGA